MNAANSKKMRRLAGAMLAVWAAFGAGSALAQGPKPDTLTVESFADANGAHPGGRLHVAVAATLAEGLHTNANKPLDPYLIPTTVTLEATEGFTVDETVYPMAETVKLAFQDEPLAVYQGTFSVGLSIQVADTVAPGGYVLMGTLRYQACNESQCFAPKKVPLEIPITVLAPADVVTPQHQDCFATIHFNDSAPAAPTAASTPAPAHPQESHAETAPADWQSLAGHFQVAGEAGGYKSAAQFLSFLDQVDAGAVPRETGMFAGKSLWLVILLTLLGGLALNLTPCVLPLIPINLAIIGAGARAGSHVRGFLLGGVYGLAMALVYGGLGLLVALTSATFGALNASPWFNAVIAIIFVVLALAMFDVILIDFSRFQSSVGLKKKEGGSFLVAFAMGGVAALLAGACVAPVVIAVILFARDLYAQGSPAGLALPFLLGLGMALPWPFAGAGLALLPKPGLWMVRVKYVFGAAILGLAAYYGHEAYSLFSARSGLDRQAVTSSAETLHEQGWGTSLAEGLAQAERERKPVLIDFWATWCKNCLVMNQTTFADPAVQDRLKRYVLVKYQAEFMDEPPANEVVQHYGVVGLPTYIVLKPVEAGNP